MSNKRKNNKIFTDELKNHSNIYIRNGISYTKIKLSKLSYGELQIVAFIRAILYNAKI